MPQSLSIPTIPQTETASRRDRISVCVCTFQRPALVQTLLEALLAQTTEGAFDFDVVIVDNDLSRSSERVVKAVARDAGIRIHYDAEPERNISLARNRAVRIATGNLVAFIDDDECPVRDWLLQLHRTLKDSGADGVLAPVIPDFPADAPRWLRDGHFLDRQRHTTGTRIGAGDARTGNVLLNRSLFADEQVWFDPAFGRTGGEDSDFFARQFRQGRVFVWCDEAVASEVVPPDRWSAAFHIKRLWRSGTLSGEWIREGRLPVTLVVRNALLLGACAVAAPVSLLLPKHMRVKVVQKLAYCAGVVSAYFGMSLFRDRD
jgi:glycosyltransferase involved in cell wall biosynthesis